MAQDTDQKALPSAPVTFLGQSRRGAYDVRQRRWWPRRPWAHSLRLRLALWYGALLAVTLGLVGVLVYASTANAIADSTDAAIRAEARVATTDLRRNLTPDPPYWPSQLALEGVDANREPGVTVVVVDDQGRIRYPSVAGHAQPIPLDASAMADARRGVGSWYSARVEGEHLRVEALPISAPGAASSHPAHVSIIGTLLVAKSLQDADTTLGTLRTLLLVMGALATCAALAGGWAIAARVLLPLGEVADTAGTIAATATGPHIGSLSRRVRRPGGHDELAHLVDAFNTMLTTLESATAAQQRFVADASHELRAPLTIVQGNLALLLARRDEIALEEQLAMLTDAHAETLRLGQLVNDLLALARADAAYDAPAADTSERAGGSARRSRLVDLDRVVLELVRQTRARLAAEGSGLELNLAHIEPVRIRGEEAALRQLALILLDNAVKYTPASDTGARVTVSLGRNGAQAVLRVRDTGIGIDAAELPHVFERFYRTDRARDRQGTGLGLPIAQSLVVQHGGTITVESAVGQGSTFTVLLPAPPLP
jgi:signal transduction histidine kinase